MVGGLEHTMPLHHLTPTKHSIAFGAITVGKLSQQIKLSGIFIHSDFLLLLLLKMYFDLTF